MEGLFIEESRAKKVFEAFQGCFSGVTVTIMVDMKLSYDPVKRDKTLLVRNLDFARANEVFSRHHFTWNDRRKNYGEQRFVTVGNLDERMVVIVWTRREDTRRIISLRKANEREQIKYGNRMD